MIGSIWAQNTASEHCERFIFLQCLETLNLPVVGIAEVDFAWVAQIVGIRLAGVAHSVAHHADGVGALHVVGALHTAPADYMVVAKDGRWVHD